MLVGIKLQNMQCRTFCLKSWAAKTHDDTRSGPHPPATIIIFSFTFRQVLIHRPPVLNSVTTVLSAFHLSISKLICCPIIKSRTSVKMHAPATSAVIAALTFNGTEMLLTVSQFYPVDCFFHDAALTLPFFFFCCRPRTLVSLSMYRDCARCFHDDFGNTFCSHVCHMVSLLVVFSEDVQFFCTEHARENTSQHAVRDMFKIGAVAPSGPGHLARTITGGPFYRQRCIKSSIDERILFCTLWRHHRWCHMREDCKTTCPLMDWSCRHQVQRLTGCPADECPQSLESVYVVWSSTIANKMVDVRWHPPGHSGWL